MLINYNSEPQVNPNAASLTVESWELWFGESTEWQNINRVDVSSELSQMFQQEKNI